MNIEQTTKEISKVVKEYLEQLKPNKQLDTYMELMKSFKSSVEYMEAELIDEIASDVEEKLTVSKALREGKLAMVREILDLFNYYMED